MRLQLGLKGRAATLVAAALVVGSLLAFSSPTALAARSQGSVLVVRVAGLPSGVTPRVRVTGPHGFSQPVRSLTERFSVQRPGRYVLIVSRAHGRGITWLAGSSKRVGVKVGKGSTRATVAYVTGRRDDAKVIAKAWVRSASLKLGGGGKLVLARSAAAGLRRGGYVVLGITNATPRGFIGRITALRPDGKSVKVTAAVASIGDVLPEASFDASIPARKVAAHAVARTAAEDEPPFSSHLACTNSAQATLTGHVSASIAPHLHVHLHLYFVHLPSFDAKLEGDIDESASLAASVSGAASCALTDAPIGAPIPLGTYTVWVEGIPITLSPVIEFTADGSVSTSAAANTSASESLHADAGIQYQNGHVSPFSDFQHSFSYQPPQFTGNASVDGGVKAKLTMRLEYSDYGPDLSVENAVNLKADTTANPCWALDDDLAANGGIDLGRYASIPDLSLYEHTFSLAHAPGPCSSTVTVTNPGNQTTAVGRLVSLPIKTTDSDVGPVTTTATGLPAGLGINPTTGVITGTPTTAGSNTVVITAKDAAGATGTTTFTWTITNPNSASPWSGTITYSGTSHAGGSSDPTVDAYSVKVQLLGNNGSVALFPSSGPDEIGGYVPEPIQVVSGSETTDSSESEPAPGCSYTGHFSAPSLSVDPNHPDALISLSYGPARFQIPTVFVTGPGTQTDTYTGSNCPANGTHPQTAAPNLQTCDASQAPNGTVQVADLRHVTGSCTYDQEGSDGDYVHASVSWDLTLSPMADSDGDGYSDLTELNDGTNPVDATSHP